MADIIVNDLSQIDEETGHLIGPVRRPMTPDEESVLAALRTQSEAVEAAETAERQRRTQRAQLRDSFGDLISPTWAQVEAGITAARAHIERPNASWTQANLVAAAKLALQICLFLVARELRRVSDGREAD